MAEETQLSIEAMLYGATDAKLREVSSMLKLTGTGGTKRQIINQIRDELDKITATLSQEESEANTAIMKRLSDLLECLKEELPPLEEFSEEDRRSSTSDVANEELERAKQEYTQLQKEFQKSLQIQEEKIALMQQRIHNLNQPSNDTIPPSKHSPSPPGPDKKGMNIVNPLNSFMQAPNFFRLKDFKIQGTISNERNRLSFTSLNKQIDSAIDRGFPESEIVDAVINAVSPQLHLKSYLEGMKNLKLQELRQILRSHYCEKSATEAYQELTNIVQEPNETPINFLMRALRIRQQILLASEEKQSRIRYDASLIQNVFINAVETGLADDAIRTRMRLYLETPNISDEVLIREMNVAMTTESERSSKLGTRRRSARQNQTNILSTEVSDKKTTKDTKATKTSVLMASLEAVQADVAMIKEAMTAQKPENAGKTRNPAKPPYACESCLGKGQAERCDHCFVCGSSEHFARGCKQKKPKQGNWRQLHLRDRV